MKPAEYPAGHYLEDNVQLNVPTYQRPFSWETDRYVDLWRDISHEYRKSGKSPTQTHFMGALILEKAETQSTNGVVTVNIIDGQQRVLTLLVLIAAIRDHMHQGKTAVPKVNDVLTIKPKFGNAVPRVSPKAQDLEPLSAILRGDFLREVPDVFFDHQLAQAYRFFRFQLWRGISSVQRHTLEVPPRPARGKLAPARGSYQPWGRRTSGRRALDLPMLHNAITSKLSMLELMLEKSDEDAGVIFETMNAKGTPLRQFDLLRNSIFVRMPSEKDSFYEDVWEHVEIELDSVSYASLRAKPQDQFFYEYVISRGEVGVSKDSLHRRWLTGVIDDIGYSVTAQSEKKFKLNHIEPLTVAALLYPIAVGQKRTVTDPRSQTKHSVPESSLVVIREIMAMSGGPVVPVILRTLLAHFDGEIDDGVLLAALHDMQSYLVRLVLANGDFSPLRAAMMQVVARLKTPFTLDDLRDSLRHADWRTDPEVMSEVVEMDTGRWTSSSFFPILRGIERELSGISAHPMAFGSGNQKFSIEHVFPQTQNIGKQWDSDLKAWNVVRDDMEEKRYALGNLTAVTGYDNKRNGKKAFADKQRLIRQTANLKLHASITKAADWTPKRIDSRTKLLAKAALSRWPRN